MNYRFDFWDYADNDGVGLPDELTALAYDVMEVGEPWERIARRERSGGIGGFVGTIRGVRLDNVVVFDRNFSPGREMIGVQFERADGGASIGYIDEGRTPRFDDLLSKLRSQYGATVPAGHPEWKPVA